MRVINDKFAVAQEGLIIDYYTDENTKNTIYDDDVPFLEILNQYRFLEIIKYKANYVI